jgi:hypothetical protein
MIWKMRYLLKEKLMKLKLLMRQLMKLSRLCGLKNIIKNHRLFMKIKDNSNMMRRKKIYSKKMSKNMKRFWE